MKEYEEVKNQISTYALTNAPKNKKADSKNYKELITDHVII